jgi:hypothetical protein
MKNKKLLMKSAAVVAMFGIYPLFVFIHTWIHVFRSDLQGGRNGPLDAYRHALASAVVSFTFNEQAVVFVSRLMESGNKQSSRMDWHNNLIGARIGAAATSFHDLEPAVRQSVSNGTVHSGDADRITWLPERKWRDDRIW